MKQFSVVRLMTDRFLAQGVRNGQLGCITEIYADGVYDVEFSDADGIIIAQVIANDNDIELARIPLR
jgi:hypothetical protein